MGYLVPNSSYCWYSVTNFDLIKPWFFQGVDNSRWSLMLSWLYSSKASHFYCNHVNLSLKCDIFGIFAKLSMFSHCLEFHPEQLFGRNIISWRNYLNIITKKRDIPSSIVVMTPFTKFMHWPKITNFENFFAIEDVFFVLGGP